MKNGKKKNSAGPGIIRSFFSSFDLFKIDVQFREGKQESFSTVTGVLISLLILSVVFVYGQKKALTMINHLDSTHQTTIE